ncbi:hypothetical protein GGF43_003967 [Coemansia sp. RSA 2618]|nr:hypothetical protein GGF43_003967 [Coemansia sp. RSA 2618]
MAQIHRQTVMGCMTQQRKGLAIALPRSQEAQARIFEAGLHRTEHSAAAAKFAAGKGAVPENNNATLSSQPGSAKAQLHPAAKAAQEAAVPSEQCVTITIPYTLPKTFGLLPENVQTSSADVAHLLADMQKAQSRHTLLLTRLIERLSATGWNVQYQQVTQHTECIEIAVAPSSGITKASDLDALLCSWGFDTSLIAAVIRDPRVPPSSSDAALEAGRTPARFAAAATDSSAASSLELDDLDSRMFSLIVDEVVDPDEAYREQVRDFLADLEIMPQLSGIRDMSLPATDKRARFGMTL